MKLFLSIMLLFCLTAICTALATIPDLHKRLTFVVLAMCIAFFYAVALKSQIK